MDVSSSRPPVATTVKQFYRPGRRSRATLSCDPCRSRKLKCDREQPCHNCITRSQHGNCKYRGGRQIEISGSTTQEREELDPMQLRIDRLESMVKTLMAESKVRASHDIKTALHESTFTEAVLGSNLPPAVERQVPDSSDTNYSIGSTVIDGDHSVYKNAHDWSDVLQEVNELRRVWQTQDEISTYDELSNSPYSVDGASLLSGQVKQISRTELLATLPPKDETDKLVIRFFDRKTLTMPVAPILHRPTFMCEYDQYWKNPSETSIMWIGLLYSILGITMLSFLQGGEPPEYEGSSERLLQLYRLRTAQCLNLGDISKCLPHTIETLLLNSTAELARNENSSRGFWIMTGIIVRTAINMGYHRDPSKTPSITGLKAELRRRVWSAVVNKDDLASFRAGFPSMLQDLYSDTREPSNLHDWELTDDIRPLPPSRPLTEFTPVTYLIFKSRLMRLLGRVSNLNNALKRISYEEVIRIDAELYRAFHETLNIAKMGDDNPSNAEFVPNKTAVAVAVLQMEFLYHHGMCALHRKFLAKARKNPKQYQLSRDRCLDSALAVLARQQGFHSHVQFVASTPYIVYFWYRESSARQSFTLAAMILFLELEHRRRRDNVDHSAPSEKVLLQALKDTCLIWRDVENTSDEAWKTSRVLRNMLSSFGVFLENTATNNLPEDTTDAANSNTEISPNGTDGQISAGTETDMDIDWATWDLFIEGISFDDAYQRGPSPEDHET